MTGYHRVHDTSQADAEETFLLRVLRPDATQVGELGVGRLDGAEDRGKTNLLLQRLDCVGGPDDTLRQVTELIVAENDLRTRVRPPLMTCLTTTIQGNVTICCVSGKDATLTRLGLDQCCPLT